MLIYKDLENEAEKKVLIRAIGRLSGREQMIIRMRFGLGTEDGEEKDSERSSGYAGDFPVLYIQTGEKDYAKIASGDGEVFMKI